MSPTTTSPEPSRTEAILDAAAKEFFEKGFAGARVDEIARRVGINKAMLYYHVGNKEELFVQVLSRAMDSARVRVAKAATSSETPRDRFRAIVEALVEEARENSHVLLLLREITVGGDLLPDKVIEKLPPVARITAGVLAEGTESGEFRAVNPLLVHLMLTASALFLTVAQPIRDRLAASGLLSSHLAISQGQIPELIADVLLNGISVPCASGENR